MSQVLCNTVYIVPLGAGTRFCGDDGDSAERQWIDSNGQKSSHAVLDHVCTRQSTSRPNTPQYRVHRILKNLNTASCTVVKAYCTVCSKK